MSNTTEVTLYDWRPFFRKIAEELVKIGQDAGTRDANIRDKAERVFDPNKGLLIKDFKYIDPFSFIYTLSTPRNIHHKNAIHIQNARNVFGISEPVTDWEFPHANPVNSLFHRDGSFIAGDNTPTDTEEQNLADIWDLFIAVYEAGTYTIITDIDERFRKFIRRPRLGLAKATQTMFLINPDVFLPIDERTLYLPLFGTKTYNTIHKSIKDGEQTFSQVMNTITAPFVKCNPYEINLFAWSLEANKLKINNTVWQINHGYEQDNCTEFHEKSAVWTDGQKDENDGRAYHLREPVRGDIMVVHSGQLARMLGIVLHNGYKEEFSSEDQIDTVFIHIDKKPVVGKNFARPAFVHRWDGIDFYPKIAELIENIKAKQRGELIMRQELEKNYKEQISLLKANHNLILTGAPGTGKTYMAKEIAQYFLNEKKDELGNSPRFGFVQFHPSYDYTDFVEGLRPIQEADQNTIGFERKDGIFKKFCQKAIENGGSHVFVIDEINRGELSKIFGELFFSIDPGYRGEDGGVTTQYANMTEEEEKFYVPENVYIIGTMNDIDRSVESMDFAMRRRFAWMEIKYDDTLENMLFHKEHGVGPLAEEAKKCLTRLNKEIETIEGLGTEYHIGASYFLKLKDLQANGDNQDIWKALWKYYLQPLLFEYVRALPDREKHLKTLKTAYDNTKTAE